MVEGLRYLWVRAFSSAPATPSLTISVDICVGYDLAFAYQALHDLPDDIVELLVRVPVQVLEHVRFTLAALDEGYLILLRHGAFYGTSGEKDPSMRKKCGMMCSLRYRQDAGSFGKAFGCGSTPDSDGSMELAEDPQVALQIPVEQQAAGLHLQLAAGGVRVHW
jgi:hypothetical protein